MADFIDVTDDVVILAHRLGDAARQSTLEAGLHANLEADLIAQLSALAGRLRGTADGALLGAFESESIRAGVAAARAAIELETAARAASDAAKQTGKAKCLLTYMAYAQCLAALGPLGREMAPAGDFAAHPFNETAYHDAGGVAHIRGHVAGAEPGAPADIRVLKDISHVHRQHARYHSLRKYDQAREIAHESHKLKTLGDLWQKGGGPKPLADVDFTDPRYRAAPCSDLNAPDAIPNIGFLFLEGAGKPPELTILEQRLAALAAEIEPFGTHLLRAMDAAWIRESALFAPSDKGGRIEIAWTRLLVVLCNWRAAHDSQVAGRLIARAADELGKLDLTPRGVRANMEATGAKLTEIGWVLDITAQLCASAGLTLADNNWRYTQYSAFLEKV